MKIGYLAAILKRYKYCMYVFFFFNMVMISCAYGVEIIIKFRWESGFLGRFSMEAPYALTDMTEEQGRPALCS